MKKQKKSNISRSNLKNKIFDIWSMIVRDRESNRCEICHAKGMMNAHHIRTKKFLSTAFDPDNGVCLCISHHRFSNEIAPHSDNCEAVENWIKWLNNSKHSEYYKLSKSSTESTIYTSELLTIKDLLLKQLSQQLGVASTTLSACEKRFKEKYY